LLAAHHHRTADEHHDCQRDAENIADDKSGTVTRMRRVRDGKSVNR
jgi:hypothetical protein